MLSWTNSCRLLHGKSRIERLRCGKQGDRDFAGGVEQSAEEAPSISGRKTVSRRSSIGSQETLERNGNQCIFWMLPCMQFMTIEPKRE